MLHLDQFLCLLLYQYLIFLCPHRLQNFRTKQLIPNLVILISLLGLNRAKGIDLSIDAQHVTVSKQHHVLRADALKLRHLRLPIPDLPGTSRD